MPDDYYVSQYSGEEIDERLTAAHNAVRYDAAQTLTDEQKAQAQGNIGAAPAGYGLGTNAVTPPNNSLDDAVKNGWYLCVPSFNGAPTGHSLIGYGTVFVIERASDCCIQVYWSEATSNIAGSPLNLVRKYNGTTWSPWEWVNPPMILGVEYRTTERYMGKPVYAKAINLGAGPSSYAQVIAYHGIANVGHIVDFGAEITHDGASALSMPYKVSDTNQGWVSANYTRIFLYAGDSDLSGYNQCTGWIKCTKTTD